MRVTTQWRGEKELYRNLTRIERNVEESTGEFLRDAAQWLVNDIRSNWSARSPSSRGNPPAVVTGNLDSSVVAESTGRDGGGRFSNTVSAIRWYVRVDTSKGVDPRNRGGYGGVLENALNRPYFAPAVERLEAIYETLAKRYIQT